MSAPAASETRSQSGRPSFPGRAQTGGPGISTKNQIAGGQSRAMVSLAAQDPGSALLEQSRRSCMAPAHPWSFYPRNEAIFQPTSLL